MDTTIFQQHNFFLSHEEEEMFQKFLTLFQEYNSHTNLSAIRDENGIIEKHFVDSLYGSIAITDFFDSDNLRVLDIGSGGGFP